MIMSTRVSLGQLEESARQGRKELKEFVENSIRPIDRGIPFIVDNQYYYCASLLHRSSELTYAQRKMAIEFLVQEHCAFGSVFNFITLSEVLKFADYSTLATILRKG